MNVMLNLKQTKELEKDDIIVFQNGSWTNVRKSEFFHKYSEQIKECEAKVAELRQDYEKMLEAINKKLKEYHDTLQVLTKED